MDIIREKMRQHNLTISLTILRLFSTLLAFFWSSSYLFNCYRAMLPTFKRERSCFKKMSFLKNEDDLLSWIAFYQIRSSRRSIVWQGWRWPSLKIFKHDSSLESLSICRNISSWVTRLSSGFTLMLLTFPFYLCFLASYSHNPSNISSIVFLRPSQMFLSLILFEHPRVITMVLTISTSRSGRESWSSSKNILLSERDTWLNSFLYFAQRSWSWS